MTLSRRGFLSGLAGLAGLLSLLSLLVWPWKDRGEDAQSWSVQSGEVWDPSSGKEFFQGRLIINENPLGESPSVQALEDTDMLAKMLEAREKLDPKEGMSLKELERHLFYGPDSDIVKLLNEPNMRPRTPLPVAKWRVL